MFLMFMGFSDLYIMNTECLLKVKINVEHF